tara:strand:- start:498 stop:1529 length:1032 start_codon:yes stop_codon:yes gene_type:complete
MTNFQINDPSLESQWRALILFGKNSATYKFAFAKSLLELIKKETTTISLFDLARPFSKNITEHLKLSDKQGNSKSSSFLNYCRDFNNGIIDESKLLFQTEKLGFVNVVDAFQNINGGQVPNLFYEKNYSKGRKEIIIKDDLLKLKESFHFQNFEQETEARWNLVETAWNLQINPNLLEVKYDSYSSLFFLENDIMRRKDITSARGSLNGYQKGKCFYSFKNISIITGSDDICHVDHFLPHYNKILHAKSGANINGVWNLVLAHSEINSMGEKGTKIPDIKFLTRLYNRNEFYIISKHPLAETIVNQTGKTKEVRRAFLQKQYDIAKSNSIVTWSPSIELKGNF